MQIRLNLIFLRFKPMNNYLLKITRLVTFIALLCATAASFAQGTRLDYSEQYKSFQKEINKVGINFNFPEGFKEIKAVNTRDFKFDYAMELPGKDFEIWLRVNSFKENRQFLHDNHLHINTDSAYSYILKQQATVFSNDTEWFTRQLAESQLSQYNANVGKTYLVNLNDSPVTKHYKYALLIVIARYNTGSVFAVCLANDRGPEFFKNIFAAGNCIKFKAQDKADR